MLVLPVPLLLLRFASAGGSLWVVRSLPVSMCSSLPVSNSVPIATRCLGRLPSAAGRIHRLVVFLRLVFISLSSMFCFPGCARALSYGICSHIKYRRLVLLFMTAGFVVHASEAV